MMRQQIIIPDTDLGPMFPLGLGAAQAGLKWDGADADRLFDAFLSFGGNVIDTARVYSDWVKPEIGRSERVLGDWFSRSKKRNHVILFTKGGHPDMNVPVPDLHLNRLSRQDMVYDVEASLKALRTDYIDIYFYHRDDKSIPVSELIETLQSFVKEGKIRYYGCSNWTSSRMKEADEYCRRMGYRSFVGNEALLNIGYKYMNPLADDTLCYADSEMQEYHKNNSRNLLIPYMGICGGFFHHFLEKGEDSVKDSPYYTEGNIRTAARIKELTEKYGITVSQAVLGFFTQQDFPCLPLYGPRNIENLSEVMKTFEIPFKKSDYSDL